MTRTEELNFIAEQLRNNNMPVKIPDKGGFSYNCWGFTAYYLGWIEEPTWMCDYEIEDLLSKKTVDIIEPVVSDIAVFHSYTWEEGRIEHTGVMMPSQYADKPMILHKPGACPLEIGSIEAAVKTYHGAKVTFRRCI